MEETFFTRTEALLGSEAVRILTSSRVAVFGIGGVGGYAVEALVRSGIGEIDLIDNDVVKPSNLNRQIIALTDTVGRPKVEVMRERILAIRPETKVHCHNVFFLPETKDAFDFSAYDYVIDAIDTVTGKLVIIEEAKKAGTPVISSMGTGNKLDPAAFKVADISKTSVCPLAKVMRRELKKRGITSLKVVYSTEEPKTPGETVSVPGRRSTPGSVSFVPPVAGFILAGEVIKDLIKSGEKR
jgi:tRNA A37 threonylcarbamoyladenosine dehydratase